MSIILSLTKALFSDKIISEHIIRQITIIASVIGTINTSTPNISTLDIESLFQEQYSMRESVEFKGFGGQFDLIEEFTPILSDYEAAEIGISEFAFDFNNTKFTYCGLTFELRLQDSEVVLFMDHSEFAYANFGEFTNERNVMAGFMKFVATLH